MKNIVITVTILFSGAATTHIAAMDNQFNNVNLKSNFVISEGYKKAILQNMLDKNFIQITEDNQEVDIKNIETTIINEYKKTEEFVNTAVNDPRVQKKMIITKILKKTKYIFGSILGVSFFYTIYKLATINKNTQIELGKYELDLKYKKYRN